MQSTHNPAERRRLLAVLAADIVAYTQLMAEDEDDTFDRLKDLNASIVTPSTARNHGQIVKWSGNGFIGVFDSAVDAVRAAIEIQSAAAAASAGAASDRQMRLRIGISAGDVITVPGNVFGDTVNAALRLQTLAAPGNICISRAIRDAVRNKFTVEYEDRGDVDLKSAAEPVGAFKIVFDPIAWTMNEAALPAAPRRDLRPYALAGVLAIALAVVGTIWLLPSKASVEAAATPPAEAVHPPEASPPESKPQAQVALVPTPTPTPAAPAPPLEPPPAQTLTASLALVLPGLDSTEGEKVATTYQAAPGHKAQSASLQPPGLWRSTKRPTTEDAKTSALENCQIHYGAPCVLIAADDEISLIPAGGKLPVHDMPRVHYNGSFDPAQIPGILPETRTRSDIASYRSAPGPKAVAFHPTGGRIFTVNGAASEHAAEESVLRTCDNDPERGGKDGPCFLYAVGNDVVLWRRLTEPVATLPSAH